MPIDTNRLKTDLKKWRNRFQYGSVFWGMAHHITAYGTALLSIFVVVIVQRPNTWTLWGLGKDDFSVWLALFAALLAVVAAMGGFERKWHSNRLSRSSIDLLRLELLDPNPNVEAICSALKQIITKHDRATLNLLREAEENKTAPSKQESKSGQTDLNVGPPSSTNLLQAQRNTPPSAGNSLPVSGGSAPRFDPASD
jgi:hypothetical protein